MKSRDVHGFNDGGSWGTSGLDLWQHHDHGMMAVEVARGKEYFPEWNVARWWLSHEAHQRDPERFGANFEAGLGIFAEHDIAVMPILFNRWRDPVCDFGGVPLDHIIPHHSAWTGSDDLFVHPDAGDVQRPTRGSGVPRSRRRRRPPPLPRACRPAGVGCGRRPRRGLRHGTCTAR